MSIRRFHPSTSAAVAFAALAAAAMLSGEAMAQGASAAGQGGRKVSQKFAVKGQPVEILADRADYEWSSSWATFYGNVVIRSNDKELRADRIRFNSETQDAEAFGRVTLIDSDGSSWQGNDLKLNFLQKSARANDMAMYYRPFFIEAGKGDVQNGAYVAEDVTFSSCTNAPGHRHYSVWGSSIRLRPERDLAARNAVVHLFGLPVFYWPYYWKDLNHHYGFRFEPGYRSKWGAYLLSSYAFNLYHDEDNRFVDSKTSVDYRTKRGVGYGERLDWKLQDYGKGWASAYFLSDDDLPDGVEDKERYRFRVNHDLNITDNDLVLLQALYVSDDRVMQDFFEDEFEHMSQPENYLSYTHSEMWGAGGVTARPRLNDFFTQVERLPEAWLNVNQVELGLSGVYYESQNSASFLRMTHDERVNPDDTLDYESARVDTWHQLSMPLKMGGFLNLIPRAAYRGTYYSDTKGEAIVSVDTNGVETVEGYRDGSAEFRNIFELGFETSFKAYGTWVDQNGVTWRHIVEPYADYSYIPEPNVRAYELYQFDDIDRIDKQNKVRPGVRQRWQRKIGDRAREFAMLDVYTDVFFETEEDQDTIDLVYLDSRISPTDWMRWEVEGRYSTADSELQRGSARVVVNHRIFEADVEYRYKVNASSLLLGGLTWKLTDEWSMHAYGIYEFEDARLERLGGYIQKQYDCIAFRLRGEVRPEYTYDDGTKDENDFRVSFTAWLTEFPPARLYEAEYR